MENHYTSSGYGPALLISCCVLLSLTLLFSLLRFYIRLYLLRIWRVEDWLFAAALISFALLDICTLISSLHGHGQLKTNINPDDVVIAVRTWALSRVFHVQTTIFTRLCIAVFLLQLAPKNQGYHFVILNIIIFATITGVCFLLVSTYQCFTDCHLWEQVEVHPPENTICLSSTLLRGIATLHATIGTLADFVFAALPTIMIYNLSIPLQAKITSCVLLSLGLFAGVANLVRLGYILSTPFGKEMLYVTTYVTICSLVEPATAIICLGISTWGPLFSRVPKSQESTRTGKG
ncbi:hypothetical protein OnM2_053038 [Erysiphe neolycopersici]|uniref:Rhodopsin domain-containing protein n=1 Tax=Erysiphe neolycopersici TaxID=212602 RepID=A0A420HRV3_9PEZI|nr:hypothetical protein OnM2_053038 [Erysiphe neolycopersici]